jgi:hypothetical protein
MLKNFTDVFLLFSCSVIFCSPSIADDQKRKSWIEWPRVAEAFAKRREQRLAVFYDPKISSNILIYPTCWLIKRKTKEVLLANCPFKLVASRLYFDGEWGYQPDGVQWGMQR